MTTVRNYFDRIQVRLLAALGMLVAGIVTVWFFGAFTLSRFADTVSDQMDGLYTSMELGTRLEATVLGQIAAGEQYLSSAQPAAEAEFDRLGHEAHRLRGDFGKLSGLSDSELQKVSRIESLHSEVEVLYSMAHANRDLGRTEAALQQVSDVGPVVGDLKGVIRELSSGEATKMTQAATTAQLTAARQQLAMAGLLAFSTLIGVFLVLRTVSAINRPLRRLVEAAHLFGEGDLNVRVEDRTMPAELRKLAEAFTGMADRMRTVVGETVTTAEQIGASASDLSSISEQVAASSGEVSTAMVGITTGAEEQAVGLRTVENALDTMRDRAGEITHTSSQVRGLSDHIRSLAESKRRDVAHALNLLVEVREVVHSSSKEVAELADSAERINDFVELIQGIAQQTNLLALNAAIEAARAGEHGRGFAVVAEEVRKLADSSASAANDVAVTVRQIRKELQDVVVAIEDGNARVGGVADASRGAETAFEEIISAVEQVRTASASVAMAAEENNGAVAAVESHLRSVGITAESHAASAQEVSAAAEEQSAATEEMSAASMQLLHAADRLKELVSGFRV